MSSSFEEVESKQLIEFTSVYLDYLFRISAAFSLLTIIVFACWCPNREGFLCVDVPARSSLTSSSGKRKRKFSLLLYSNILHPLISILMFKILWPRLQVLHVLPLTTSMLSYTRYPNS
ncbi:MAG: hypothetical protein CL912_07025 [Deltaproteobacteria bacterium]|nr:hypothetical protein [Deltaproteobacteria bacterium]